MLEGGDGGGIVVRLNSIVILSYSEGSGKLGFREDGDGHLPSFSHSLPRLGNGDPSGW